MLQFLITRLRRIEHAMSKPARREAVDAWSLLIGREAAELWLEALSSHAVARPNPA